MAFDWTKVEGYSEELSADEKLALLENYEQPEEPENREPLKGHVPKAQFDKLASELASVKKQLRTRMSDDEQKQLDRDAADEAMRQELETLRKEKQISTYKASYLAQGYDEKLAEEAANAMADGDTDTVFALMNKQKTITEKAIRAKLLAETPTPPAGDDLGKDAKEKAERNARRKALGLNPI